MHPYAHKTSVLSKGSRKETACFDDTVVFAPLLGRLQERLQCDPVAADEEPLV